MLRPLLRSFLIVGISAITTTWACHSEADDARVRLPNSEGKDDSTAIRLRLTDSNPAISLAIGCDQAGGCEGELQVRLISPDPCELFPDQPLCGIGPTGPLNRETLAVTITSDTEGVRRIPLRVETGDGEFFTTQLAAAFSALEGAEVGAVIEKTAGTPDLLIEVLANWRADPNPGSGAAQLRAFLATIPGLTFVESGTSHAGYRAYTLSYQQPLDHGDPSAGTFMQSMVLHHRHKDAPTVLYTSGYGLFDTDYLSELGEALAGNQLSTEQRFFGSSFPQDFTPESWRYVNIQQAATDHHRIVEALSGFYAGAWLSTGHSKGGMTSIFHRRFFPDDVDATIAYVAPISYADPDPRYVPFLDTIGEEACRNAVRAVQRNALSQFDQLFALAKLRAGGAFYNRAGGHESAFEKAIILLEWVFWQHGGITKCEPFLHAPTDPEGLYELIAGWVGGGLSDSATQYFQAYYYQAATQLGKQQLATQHLSDLLHYEHIPFDWSPTGTMPVHDPAPMVDVQNWVKSSGNQILFLYGQYDPWSGGAYEVGDQPEVVKLFAPKATHAAMVRSLETSDRDRVVSTIGQWIGVQPVIDTPSGAPHPPLPLVP